jgi:hypothetical protein
MNDGAASGSGDGRHAGESHGEGAAGGNMAPPQALLGSGTFFKDMRASIYTCCSCLFRETRTPRLRGLTLLGSTSAR